MSNGVQKVINGAGLVAAGVVYGALEVGHRAEAAVDRWLAHDDRTHQVGVESGNPSK
jgi:hypothetical protein